MEVFIGMNSKWIKIINFSLLILNCLLVVYSIIESVLVLKNIKIYSIFYIVLLITAIILNLAYLIYAFILKKRRK